MAGKAKKYKVTNSIEHDRMHVRISPAKGSFVRLNISRSGVNVSSKPITPQMKELAKDVGERFTNLYNMKRKYGEIVDSLVKHYSSIEA